MSRQQEVGEPPDGVGSGQSGQRVVQSFAGGIVDPHQDHGRQRFEVTERQFTQTLRVALDLVLAAGVKLPRGGVNAGGDDAGQRKRRGQSIESGRQRGSNRQTADAGEHGGLVQQVADDDGTRGLFAELTRLNDNSGDAVLQGALQFGFECSRPAVAVVDFVDYGDVVDEALATG